MGLMINPAPTFTLNNGDIASEGLLYFYENGSTTVKKAIYSNSNLTTELINPLPLTDAGRLPTCFGDGTYTIILKSSDDVQQWVRNDVTIGDLAGQFSDYSSVKTYSVNEIARYTDGNYYISDKNNNKGNAPAENSEFWSKIAFLEFFNTEKAADNGYSLNDVVISGGFLYRSLENNNGDTPPGAKWANLTFNDSVAGNFAIGGSLTVTGETTIGGNGSVGGQLDVTGTLSSADLTVTGGIVASGNINVAGGATLGTALPLASGGTGSSTPAGARTNLELGTSAVETYITQNVILDGAFTGSFTLVCTKIGRMVTISTPSNPTHSSSSNPATSAGLIPVAYRPASNIQNVLYVSNSIFASIIITSSGTLSLEYRAFSTGALFANTGSPCMISVSYNV